MTEHSQQDVNADHPSFGRRNFIKQSVVSLGVTVQEYVKHSDATPVENPAPAATEPAGWLRPPGAVSEDAFLERCTRCRDCIDACPHAAIRESVVSHTPVIFPEDQPCRLCEDVPCIDACGTDALVSVTDTHGIAMGTAQVHHRDCTASHGCHACVSACPHQAITMDFSAFRLSVDEHRCVGCGICQHVCRSVNDRVAIRVFPSRLQVG